MLASFKSRLLVVFLIGALVGCVDAPLLAEPQVQPAPTVAQAIDARVLDAYFDALESNDRLMGSVAVSKNGEIVYERAFGFRAQPGPGGLESNPETMFRIGSITKIHTATMIYQLIDEDRIRLETPLGQFFPTIPNAGQVTISHLLAHCSGLPNYTRQIDPSDPKSWNYAPQTQAAMVARFAASQPEFAPGERVAYSNTNYVLLGYIVEAVTKSSYGEQLEKRIVKRAGLTRTRYGGTIDPEKNEARSYSYGDAGWSQSLESDASVAAGAGAITATSKDLARFISKLFDGGLVSDRSIEAMTTPFAASLEGPERKGVVVHTLGRWLNKKAYSKRGGIDAFQSNLVYVPEDRLAIALTFNGQNYPMGKVFWSVVEACYGRPVTAPSFSPVALSAVALESFAGDYTCKEIGMGMTIHAEKNGLRAQATGQDAFELEPIAELLFSHKPSGILVEFRKADDGSYSTFSLFQGAGELRFARNEVPK